MPRTRIEQTRLPGGFFFTKNSAGNEAKTVSPKAKKDSHNAVARAAGFRNAVAEEYVQGRTVVEQCRSNCRGKRDSPFA